MQTWIFVLWQMFLRLGLVRNAHSLTLVAYNSFRLTESKHHHKWGLLWREEGHTINRTSTCVVWTSDNCIRDLLFGSVVCFVSWTLRVSFLTGAKLYHVKYTLTNHTPRPAAVRSTSRPCLLADSSLTVVIVQTLQNRFCFHFFFTGSLRQPAALILPVDIYKTRMPGATKQTEVTESFKAQ